MSEWDKNRHVPIEELEGREEFVRDNAMALLRQRDEQIREQKGALSQCNNASRDGEKQIARLRAEVERLNVELAGCLTAAEGHTSPDFVAQTGDHGWSLAYEKVLRVRRERDEALAQVECLKVERDGAVKRAQMCLEHADHFKAQVAVILDRYDHESVDADVKEKARALLDRLQHFEDALNTKEERTQAILAKLERAEAVVEAAMAAPTCDTGWRGENHEPCHQQLEVWIAELLERARAAWDAGKEET